MKNSPNGSDSEVQIDAVSGIDAAVRAADLLRALANPHRLMIMRLLQATPRTVMDLCSILGLRQSLVSQHLARLRLDGVVRANRQGHFVIYAVSSDGACRILETLFDVMADQNDIDGPIRNAWSAVSQADESTPRRN